jgi:predicted nucleic acid-binding protein
VLVYAVDDAELEKREMARQVLGSSQYGEFVLSTQILGEFYVTVTRKLSKPLSDAKAAEALDGLSRQLMVTIDTALVKGAIQISRDSQISYWDGLVVAAAVAGGCDRLLTEDLNAGQQIGSVYVENPFHYAL